MNYISLSLARAYQHVFETRPNTTLAITGGCFNSLGDIVAQISQNFWRKEHQPRHAFDPARTFRFFCFGVAITPFIGRWNKFLEHQFPLRPAAGSGKVSMKALSKRVACDQLFMAPIGLMAFIGSMGIMENRGLEHIRQKYNDLFFPALVTNWQVWPLAQLINFRYMPLPYRVPFQSTCGVFWTLYLSTINSGEVEKQEHEIDMRRTLDSRK